MKSAQYLVKFIEFYQKNISVYTKPTCVFYPTCSSYAKEAILKYGLLKGSLFAFCRIMRCHPWQKPQVDLLK